MNFKKCSVAMVAIITMVLATVSFAHLPSANSRSVIMGRQTGPDGELISEFGGRGPRSGGYRSPAAWSRDIQYQGSHIRGEGDTVWHGTFNGQRLYWWARFAADSTAVPGEMAREGGTPPWVLINSASALSNNGRPNFQAATWHGNRTTIPAIRNIPAGQARVPTWRDGACGAYAITLDDIGSMPFDLSVRPAWDLLRYHTNPTFREIKMAWGIHVGLMDDNDWTHAIEMVARYGHEMFNHSIDHTSAADGWQIFFPGQNVSETDPAVPPSIRGLEVVGTWRVFARSAQGVWVGSGGRTMPGGTATTPPAGLEPFNFGPDADGGRWAPGSSHATSFNWTAAQAATTNASSFGNPATHMPNGSLWIDNAPNGTGGHPFTIFAESDMVTIQYPAYWTGYDPATNARWDDPRIIITPNPTGFFRGHPIQTVTLAGGQRVFVAYSEPFNYDADQFTGHQTGYIAATGAQWFENLETNYPHFFNGARIQTDWNSPGCTQSGCPTAGQPGWFVSTRDLGRPGFAAKLFVSEAWNPAMRARNIDTANYIINRNIFENITTAGEHFARGRRSEFYGFPFDIYDENLLMYLYNGVNQQVTNRFVGARGGAKSGQPMSGDFFHPFRIDFDAFFINNSTWRADNSHLPQFKVPHNAHVLLGINEMVDDIVEANGFMIRELHSVSIHTDGPGFSQGGGQVVSTIPWFDESLPDELWPVNTQMWQGQRTGGWWGGITVRQMEEHFTHVANLIDQRHLTVFTPSEAVKYRMTRNAFNTDANLTEEGLNWTVRLTPTSAQAASAVDEIHREEISVIVNLGTHVQSLGVSYDGTTTNTSDLNSPRRRPRPMDWVAGQGAQIWSVSINPFRTANHSALLIRDGDWHGQDIVFNENPGEFIPAGITNGRTMNRVAPRAQFAGIRNGQINLNLQSGNYTVQLFNLQGRMIGSANINALNGVNATGLRTDHLARGLLILQVRDAQGASVLQHRFMLR
ncbi:MAG: T9SS type A sorting domain-containing protein [Chitinivibrionia bacterium]|nr:T9SS type A sorting domain-containing protein [Chitinivibrionia bacterium]